ncbi:hypothetical protein [Roseovarius sp.]|uniref:hypothetical protein n=1 Tax=Roseovarius sp. TaxID=1486281 RepID=UPI00257D4C30|nr:hypothetical protein [Roseovarius sp.]|tara:strand:+ start:951 stop:1469 length:519 start_codon:yes stop_codon:yes gene_type:complete
MGRQVYRGIEIRGVVYPDANAAAAALGVSANAVRLAVRKGSQHRIGTGAVGVEPMPICLAGTHFENAEAAAEHFGVTRHAVYQAIASGRAQEFGKPARHARLKSRPIALGNLSFSSMDEACRVLGFERGYISQVKRRGSKVGMQRVLAAAMREARRRETASTSQRKHEGVGT